MQKGGIRLWTWKFGWKILYCWWSAVVILQDCNLDTKYSVFQSRRPEKPSYSLYQIASCQRGNPFGIPLPSTKPNTIFTTNTNSSVMNFPTLEDYLIQQGVDENTSPERKEILKTAYKTAYQKAYGKERRKRERDIKVRMEVGEYQRMKSAAKKHGYTHLSPFLKASAFAYIDQRFLLMEDSKLRALEISIQRIGHNINQLVHQAHAMKLYNMEQTYTGLRHEVKNLKAEVQQHLRQPPNLFEQLQDVLLTDPHLISAVEAILENAKKASS